MPTPPSNPRAKRRRASAAPGARRLERDFNLSATAGSHPGCRVSLRVASTCLLPCRNVRTHGESWKVSGLTTDIGHSALMTLRREQPHIALPMSRMICAGSLALKGTNLPASDVEGSTNRDWVGRRGHAQKPSLSRKRRGYLAQRHAACPQLLGERHDIRSGLYIRSAPHHARRNRRRRVTPPQQALFQ